MVPLRVECSFASNSSLNCLLGCSSSRRGMQYGAITIGLVYSFKSITWLTSFLGGSLFESLDYITFLNSSSTLKTFIRMSCKMASFSFITVIKVTSPLLIFFFCARPGHYFDHAWNSLDAYGVVVRKWNHIELLQELNTYHYSVVILRCNREVYLSKSHAKM